MKVNKYFSLASLLLMFVFAACQKAGVGGEATIVAFPKHHDMPIPGTILYIKYGATEFPGEDVSVYDDSKIAVADMGEDPHVHFENLRKGDYYIYGVGFDSSINQIVKGGIPITIKDKAGETDIVVPVTEGN